MNGQGVGIRPGSQGSANGGSVGSYDRPPSATRAMTPDNPLALAAGLEVAGLQGSYYKLCKKTAQLSKVIAILVSKADEMDYERKYLHEAYQGEITKVYDLADRAIKAAQEEFLEGPAAEHIALVAQQHESDKRRYIQEFQSFKVKAREHEKVMMDEFMKRHQRMTSEVEMMNDMFAKRTSEFTDVIDRIKADRFPAVVAQGIPAPVPDKEYQEQLRVEYEKELDRGHKDIQRKYDMQKTEDDRVHRVNLEAVSKEYEAELDRRRIRAAMYEHEIKELKQVAQDMEILANRKEKQVHDIEKRFMDDKKDAQKHATAKADALREELVHIQTHMEQALAEDKEKMQAQFLHKEQVLETEFHERLQTQNLEAEARVAKVESETRTQMHSIFMKFQATFAEKERAAEEQVAEREELFRQMETDLRAQLADKHEQLMNAKKVRDEEVERKTSELRAQVEELSELKSALTLENDRLNREKRTDVENLELVTEQFKRESEQLARSHDEAERTLESNNRELLRRLKTIEDESARMRELESENTKLKDKLEDLVMETKNDIGRKEFVLGGEIETLQKKLDDQEKESTLKYNTTVREFEAKVKFLEEDRTAGVQKATDAFERWRVLLDAEAEKRIADEVERYKVQHVCPECTRLSEVVQSRHVNEYEIVASERQRLEALHAVQMGELQSQLESQKSTYELQIQDLRDDFQAKEDRMKFVHQDELQTSLHTYEESLKGKVIEWEIERGTLKQRFLEAHVCPTCTARAAADQDAGDATAKRITVETDRIRAQCDAEMEALIETMDEQRELHSSQLAEAAAQRETELEALRLNAVSEAEALEAKHKDVMDEAARDAELAFHDRLAAALREHNCEQCTHLTKMLESKGDDAMQLVENERKRLEALHEERQEAIRLEGERRLGEARAELELLRASSAEERKQSEESHIKMLTEAQGNIEIMLKEQRKAEEMRLETHKKEWEAAYICPDCDRMAKLIESKHEDVQAAVNRERARMEGLYGSQVDVEREKAVKAAAELAEQVAIDKAAKEAEFVELEKKNEATLLKLQDQLQDMMDKQKASAEYRIKELQDEVVKLQSCQKCVEQREKNKSRVKVMKELHQEERVRAQELHQAELDGLQRVRENEAAEYNARVLQTEAKMSEKLAEKDLQYATLLKTFDKSREVASAQIRQAHAKGMDDAWVDNVFEECRQCTRLTTLWNDEKAKVSKLESIQKSLSGELQLELARADSGEDVLAESLKKINDMKEEMETIKAVAQEELAAQVVESEANIRQLAAHHDKASSQLVEKFGSIMESKEREAEARVLQQLSEQETRYVSVVTALQETLQQAIGVVTAANYSSVGVGDDVDLDSQDGIDALASATPADAAQASLAAEALLDLQSKLGAVAQETEGEGSARMDTTLTSLQKQVSELFQALARRLGEQMDARVRGETLLRSLLTRQKEVALVQLKEEIESSHLRRIEGLEIQRRTELATAKTDHEVAVRVLTEAKDLLQHKVASLGNEVTGLQSEIQRYTGFEQMSREFKKRADDALELLETERARLTNNWMMEVAALKETAEHTRSTLEEQLQRDAAEHAETVRALKVQADEKNNSMIASYETLLQNKLTAVEESRQAEVAALREEHQSALDAFYKKWVEDTAVIEERYTTQPSKGLRIGSAAALFLESASLAENIARLKDSITTTTVQGEDGSTTKTKTGGDAGGGEGGEGDGEGGSVVDASGGDGGDGGDDGSDNNAEDDGSGSNGIPERLPKGARRDGGESVRSSPVAKQVDAEASGLGAQYVRDPTGDHLELLLREATGRLHTRLEEKEREEEELREAMERDFATALDAVQAAAEKQVRQARETEELMWRGKVEDLRVELAQKVKELEHTQSSLMATVSELQSKATALQLQMADKDKDMHDMEIRMMQEADADYQESKLQIDRLVKDIAEQKDSYEEQLKGIHTKYQETQKKEIFDLDTAWMSKFHDSLQKEKERNEKQEADTKMQMNELLSELQRDMENLRTSGAEHLEQREAAWKETEAQLLAMQEKQRAEFEVETTRISDAYKEYRAGLEAELDEQSSLAAKRLEENKQLAEQCEALARSLQETRSLFIKEMDEQARGQQDVDHRREAYVKEIELELAESRKVEKQYAELELKLKSVQDEFESTIEEMETAKTLVVKKGEEEIKTLKQAMDRQILNAETKAARSEEEHALQVKSMEAMQTTICNDLVRKYEALLARREEEEQAFRKGQLEGFRLQTERAVQNARTEVEKASAEEAMLLAKENKAAITALEDELRSALQRTEAAEIEAHEKGSQLEFMSAATARNQAEFLSQTRETEKAVQERIDAIHEQHAKESEEARERAAKEYQALEVSHAGVMTQFREDIVKMEREVEARDLAVEKMAAKVSDSEGKLKVEMEKCAAAELRLEEFTRNVEMLKIEYMTTIKTNDNEFTVKLQELREHMEAQANVAATDAASVLSRVKAEFDVTRADFTARLDVTETALGESRVQLAKLKGEAEANLSMLAQRDASLASLQAQLTEAQEKAAKERAAAERAMEDLNRKRDEELFLQSEGHDRDKKEYVAKADAIYADLKADMISTRDKLMADVAARDSTISELQLQNEAVEEQLKIAKAANMSKQDGVAQLQQKVEALEGEQLTLRAQCRKEVNAMMNEMETQRVTMLQQYANERNEYRSRSEAEYAALDAELKRTLQDLGDKLHAAESAASASEEVANEAEERAAKLEANAEADAARVIEAEKALVEARKEGEFVKAQSLKEVHKAQAESHIVIGEMTSKMKIEREALEEATAQRIATMEAELASATEEMKTTMATMQQELTAKVEEVHTLEIRTAEANNNAQRLATSLSTMTGQYEQVKSALDRAQTNFTKEVDKSKVMREQELNALRERMTIEKEEVQTKADETQAQLRDDVARNRQEARDNHRKWLEAVEALRSLQSATEGQEGVVAELKAALEALRQEMAHAVEAAHISASHVKAQLLEELKAKDQEAKAAISEIQERFQEEKVKVEANATASIESATAEFLITRESLESRLVAAESVVGVLENERDQFRSAAERAEGIATTKEEEMVSLMKDLRSLEDKLMNREGEMQAEIERRRLEDGTRLEQEYHQLLEAMKVHELRMKAKELSEQEAGFTAEMEKQRLAFRTTQDTAATDAQERINQYQRDAAEAKNAFIKLSKQLEEQQQASATRDAQVADLERNTERLKLEFAAHMQREERKYETTLKETNESHRVEMETYKTKAEKLFNDAQGHFLQTKEELELQIKQLEFHQSQHESQKAKVAQLEVLLHDKDELADRLTKELEAHVREKEAAKEQTRKSLGFGQGGAGRR